MTRALSTTLLLVLAASAAPASAQGQGSSPLAAIDGRSLPAPAPRDGGFTIRRASLVFEVDGLDMHARSGARGSEEESSEGRAGTYDHAFIAAPAASGQELQGSFRLMRVNGEDLPTPSPGEETVRIDGLAVVLRADGRYAMEVRAHHVAQDTPIALEIGGTYRVEMDRLVLHPDEGAQADPAEFRWTLEGGTLRMVDERGDEYTFARQ